MSEQPFLRFYDSVERVDGPFGAYWRSPFDVCAIPMTLRGNWFVLIRMPEGRPARFREIGYRTYQSPSEVPGSLEVDSSGHFVLRFRNGSTWQFNAENRLQTAVDRTGKTWAYSYDSAGRLAHLGEPGGRSWDLTYNGLNKVASVSDGTRTWSYQYDALGNLSSATYPDSGQIRYRYESSNGSHFLTSVTNRRGQEIGAYTYDMFGRLTTFSRNGRTFARTYAQGSVEEHPVDEPLDSVRRYFDSLGHLTAVERPTQGTVRTSYYDERGLLVRTIDARGNITRHSYDSSSNRTGTVDPLGQLTQFGFDSQGQQVATTDSLGHTTSKGYDSIGNLIATTDPLGATTRMTFTTNNLLDTVTDSLGHATRYTYDGSGHEVSHTRTAGTSMATIAYTWDGNGNRTSVTDANAGRTDFDYDVLGRLARASGPAVAVGVSGQTSRPVTTLSYDFDGNLVARVDALGRTTITSYDAWNHKLWELTPPDATFPNGVTTRYAWSEERLVATTDPRGNTTAYTYDHEGRVLTSANALGGTKRFGYDLDGNSISTTDERTNTTLKSVDALNRVTEVVASGDNGSTRFAYDAVGNLTVTTDALGRETHQFYDEVNRLVEKQEPNGTRTRTEFDALGNRTAVVRAYGTALAVWDEYQYDALSRLASVTRGKATSDEVTVNFGYDLNGNVTSVTNGRGKTWHFSYDALNRLTTETDPLNRSKHYFYDLAGQLVERRDAKGQKIQYDYSPTGKVTEARYIRADDSVENVARMTYDSVGNMTRVTDTNVDIEQEFDALNRITSINHHHLNKVQRQGWDAAGNRTWMSVEGIPNSTATYEWDSRNRLAAIHHASMGDVTFAYNLVGQKTGMTYPGGILGSWEYDPNGRLTTLSYRREGNSPLFFESLTYDARGNITQRVDDEGTHAYQYDWLDQLTRADYPGGSFEAFGYDRSGNRSTLTTAGGTAAYAVDDADQLLSVSGPGTTETVAFAWTANGEMASRLASGATTPTSYSWSTREMMTRVSLPSGAVLTYAYLPEQWLGWRLSASSLTTGPTAMVWDPVTRNVIADLDASGAVLAGYAEGPGMDAHLGRISATTGARHAYLGDHLGSAARLAAIGSGGSDATYRYAAYGSLRGGADPGTGNRFTFTGREWDEISRSYNHRARWMQPESGLFLSRDRLAQQYHQLLHSVRKLRLREPSAAFVDGHVKSEGAYATRHLLRLSASSYVYGLQNPILYLDPTGNEAGTAALMCWPMFQATPPGWVLAAVASAPIVCIACYKLIERIDHCDDAYDGDVATCYDLAALYGWDGGALQACLQLAEERYWDCVFRRGGHR